LTAGKDDEVGRFSRDEAGQTRLEPLLRVGMEVGEMGDSNRPRAGRQLGRDDADMDHLRPIWLDQTRVREANRAQRGEYVDEGANSPHRASQLARCSPPPLHPADDRVQQEPEREPVDHEQRGSDETDTDPFFDQHIYRTRGGRPLFPRARTHARTHAADAMRFTVPALGDRHHVADRPCGGPLRSANSRRAPGRAARRRVDLIVG